MAGFHTKTFIKHDDYMTPKYAWENIKHIIPKDKVIWESFYGDGKSGEYLKELGFNVIHEPVDFFENDLGEVICSNPPFSLVDKIMNRLLLLDKPFILLMPVAKLHTNALRKWEGKGLKLVVPRKRVHFDKLENGEITKTKKCNFDCYYYCYKIDLPNALVFLQ